jgi:hypothetical protein
MFNIPTLNSSKHAPQAEQGTCNSFLNHYKANMKTLRAGSFSFYRPGRGFWLFSASASFSNLEHKAQDSLFSAQRTKNVSGEVVIVAIDKEK